MQNASQNNQTYIKGCLCDDKGTWAVRARVPDPITGEIHNRTKSTGYKVAGNNRRKAEIKMREIISIWENEARTGTVRDCNPDFGSCVNNWLEEKELTLKPNTLKSYRVIANAHIIPKLGAIRICDLTRQDIVQYFECLKGKISPNSMKKHKVIINGVLESACADDIIPSNVSARVKLPTAPKFEGTALSESQIALLFGQLENQPEPIKSAVFLAVTYGLRRSEICGLRWDDIDFDNRTMYIRNTVTEYSGMIIESEQTKTKASRRNLCLIESTIPYLESLKQTQMDLKCYSGKVCAHLDGRKVKPEYITRVCIRFLRECGFEGVRLHDLRHTVATYLANHVPLKHVQSYLGHESIKTTSDIYTHTLTEDKFSTAQNLDSFFKNIPFCSEVCSE